MRVYVCVCARMYVCVCVCVYVCGGGERGDDDDNDDDDNDTLLLKDKNLNTGQLVYKCVPGDTHRHTDTGTIRHSVTEDTHPHQEKQ